MRIEIRENKGSLLMVIKGFLGSLIIHDQLEFYNSELHLIPSFAFYSNFQFHHMNEIQLSVQGVQESLTSSNSLPYHLLIQLTWR